MFRAKYLILGFFSYLTLWLAFLFGLCIPRGTQLFHTCNECIEELVLVLFLPLYFAISGLKTDVTQIKTSAQGAMVILVCFIASLGKFLGCGGMAYFSGLTIRESASVSIRIINFVWRYLDSKTYFYIFVSKTKL